MELRELFLGGLGLKASGRVQPGSTTRNDVGLLKVSDAPDSASRWFSSGLMICSLEIMSKSSAFGM